MFAQTQVAVADAEALLVDEGCQVAASEPAVVEPPANGANGKGEVAAAVNGNGGNGRRGTAAAPQQEPFPWAEFLAQVTAQPKRQRKQSLPASLPLLEWVLAQEQEAALVGAGR